MSVFAALTFCCACSLGTKTQESTSTVGLATVSASASPASGMSSVVTADFSDPKGVNNISTAGVLVNATPDGAASCYVVYIPPGTSLALVRDAGSGSDVLDLSRGGSVSNSQCTFNAAQTAVEHKGNDLILKVNLAFRPSSKGLKNIYLYAENKDGEKVGLQAPVAQWSVQ